MRFRFDSGLNSFSCFIELWLPLNGRDVEILLIEFLFDLNVYSRVKKKRIILS